MLVAATFTTTQSFYIEIEVPEGTPKSKYKDILWDAFLDEPGEPCDSVSDLFEIHEPEEE